MKQFTWPIFWVIVTLLLLSMLYGCASTQGRLSDPNDLSSTIYYGSMMGSREPIIPDDVRKWEAIKCTPVQLKATYWHIFDGNATAGEVMYYFRCRGPNEYKEYLNKIRTRWRY